MSSGKWSSFLWEEHCAWIYGPMWTCVSTNRHSSFLPNGTMHFAFTPELDNGGPPGAVTCGTHFFSWCWFLDTLHSLWCLRMTQSQITNANHEEIWSLLSCMLLVWKIKPASVRKHEIPPLPIQILIPWPLMKLIAEAKIIWQLHQFWSERLMSTTHGKLQFTPFKWY
jgi:hypothetical protein